MKLETKLSAIFFVLALLVMAALVSAPAWASGDDLVQSNDMNTQTAGDVITGSHQAYALSGSLGDVDINQCLGSEAWGIVIFQRQKLVENDWCEAESLYRLGFIEASVLKFCTQTSVKALYPDLKACKAGMVSVIRVSTTDDPAPPDEVREEPDEDRHAAHESDLRAINERIDKVEAERVAAARRSAAAKREEQQQAQRLLEQYANTIPEQTSER